MTRDSPGQNKNLWQKHFCGKNNKGLWHDKRLSMQKLKPFFCHKQPFFFCKETLLDDRRLSMPEFEDI